MQAQHLSSKLADDERFRMQYSNITLMPTSTNATTICNSRPYYVPHLDSFQSRPWNGTALVSETNSNFTSPPLSLAGTGARGHADGNQAVGQFNAPMGLFLQGSQLWIADSGNQRLRRIDAVE